MCRMKVIISVNISLMTFRQQINPKQTDNLKKKKKEEKTKNMTVFSKSHDLNFRTKWSRISK